MEKGARLQKVVIIRNRAYEDETQGLIKSVLNTDRRWSIDSLYARANGPEARLLLVNLHALFYVGRITIHMAHVLRSSQLSA